MRTQAEHQKSSKTTIANLDVEGETVIFDAHTALNIALFPPLFFFSGLYYTDVVSTLFVLLSYSTLLKKKTPAGSVLERLNIVILGTMALFFRQTNIFWVAVFPAGLLVVDTLKDGSPSSTSSNTSDASTVLKKAWSEGKVHDCALHDAELQGM